MAEPDDPVMRELRRFANQPNSWIRETVAKRRRAFYRRAVYAGIIDRHQADQLLKLHEITDMDAERTWKGDDGGHGQTPA